MVDHIIEEATSLFLLDLCHVNHVRRCQQPLCYQQSSFFNLLLLCLLNIYELYLIISRFSIDCHIAIDHIIKDLLVDNLTVRCRSPRHHFLDLFPAARNLQDIVELVLLLIKYRCHCITHHIDLEVLVHQIFVDIYVTYVAGFILNFDQHI